ncbi:MAG: hypothetical protein IKR41_06780 [Bacteroidales bacterium]|nr:hypothetical protein [Bacteroidales bacterium]
MKRLFTILISALIFVVSACSNGGSSVKEELQGRYEIDMSPLTSLMEDEMKAKNSISSDMFSSMLFSQLDLTVQFEKEKAILDASAIASELIKQFSKGKVTLPYSADYKIENDTALYMRAEGSDFNYIGSLKRLGDSYDYLKLTVDKNDKKIEVNLKKIK